MERWNSLQSTLDELHLETYNQEVQDQFWDFMTNVPYIRALVSADIPCARDLPRDDKGRIIIDITKPHLLEDMEYFRPAARHYETTGHYTDLRPNSNPTSEYGKWIREEVRRCLDGYVRESDGEWIPGDLYFFWNYCPIQVIKEEEDGMYVRSTSFPFIWAGHYYKAHYLNQARVRGMHAVELSRRGSGKSYFGAAMLAKRFVLGETKSHLSGVGCVAAASDRKYIQGADQILDKFVNYIDFLALNTQFPARRLVNSIQNMMWTMGYTDVDTGARRGSQNFVKGITAKDNEAALRGTRGALYVLEEAGTFKRLKELYNVTRDSVESGSKHFGMIYAYGTAGDSDSDFASLQELMYNAKGYNVCWNPNVYDKEGQGRPTFTYFFPAYMNREGCYDKDGNSNVTKALLEILQNRYVVKYNTTDLNAITATVSQQPITPQEAIIRSRGNLFPVTELTQRLNEIDNNPAFYDNIYVGNLGLDGNGGVFFEPSTDKPIRDYPLKDNKATGALEIYEMPQKDPSGKVFSQRYIIGLDPIDQDQSQTLSLYSFFVLDLWTDHIVAEYTGRLAYADDCYELTRRACLFYHARCLYEANKRGIYAYFMRTNSLYLLAETPEYLRDRNIIKTTGYGNNAYGVNATSGVNDYADRLIRDWLMKHVPIMTTDADGEEIESSTFNLMFINSRALVKELMLYDKLNNFDRVRALGMLMIYREQFMALYGGDPGRARDSIDADYLGRDDYFTTNFDHRFKAYPAPTSAEY